MKHRTALTAIVLACAASAAAPAAQGARPQQAVVETTAGTFVIDLTPATAPNQTAYFIKLASEGTYDGTTLHTVVRNGMVQGGDPLTKDPAKRAQYGTGGLNAVKAEPRAPKLTRGSVAAVLIPQRPDSAGSQFFIVLADQPTLDNQYTVFGHIADGVEVLQKISEAPVDDKGLVTERIAIAHVTIRDTPADPFVSETPQQLAGYRAVLDSSAGPITIEFFLDRGPKPCANSCGSPRPASTTTWRFTAWHRGSSFKPVR
jgi:cyclophilin family peptidyl-prolyl cis-trans isomerase